MYTSLNRPGLKDWDFVDATTNEPKTPQFIEQLIDDAKKHGTFRCDDAQISLIGQSSGVGFDLRYRSNRILALKASRNELIAVTIDYTEIILFGDGIYKQGRHSTPQTEESRPAKTLELLASREEAAEIRVSAAAV